MCVFKLFNWVAKVERIKGMQTGKCVAKVNTAWKRIQCIKVKIIILYIYAVNASDTHLYKCGCECGERFMVATYKTLYKSSHGRSTNPVVDVYGLHTHTHIQSHLRLQLTSSRRHLICNYIYNFSYFLLISLVPTSNFPSFNRFFSPLIKIPNVSFTFNCNFLFFVLHLHHATNSFLPEFDSKNSFKYNIIMQYWIIATAKN